MIPTWFDYVVMDIVNDIAVIKRFTSDGTFEHEDTRML